MEHLKITKYSSAVFLWMSVQFHGFDEDFVKVSNFLETFFLELYLEVAIHNSEQGGLFQIESLDVIASFSIKMCI